MSCTVSPLLHCNGIKLLCAQTDCTVKQRKLMTGGLKVDDFPHQCRDEGYLCSPVVHKKREYYVDVLLLTTVYLRGWWMQYWSTCLFWLEKYFFLPWCFSCSFPAQSKDCFMTSVLKFWSHKTCALKCFSCGLVAENQQAAGSLVEFKSNQHVLG